MGSVPIFFYFFLAKTRNFIDVGDNTQYQ